jgi:hypothetical protein
MAKKDKARFKSTTGLNDLLFNLLVGFVFLFIIAFLLINPPTKKEEAPKKAEYLIVIEWDTVSNDDIDLWVQDPSGVTVSFTQKEGGLLNLEKDDLGISNDSWITPQGERVVIPINREVVTMRGIVPGRYKIAAHIYSMRNAFKRENGVNVPLEDKRTIIATLIKINPYGEKYRVTKKYEQRGQVITLFNFELDEGGTITAIDDLKNNIVYSKRANTGGAVGGPNAN